MKIYNLFLMTWFRSHMPARILYLSLDRVFFWSKLCRIFTSLRRAQDSECVETRFHSPFTFRPSATGTLTQRRWFPILPRWQKWLLCRGVRQQWHLCRQHSSFAPGIRKGSLSQRVSDIHSMIVSLQSERYKPICFTLCNENKGNLMLALILTSFTLHQKIFHPK